MKNILIICLLLSGVIPGKLTFAQSSSTTSKEKMQAFAAWPGRWQGEGSIQMGPGEPKRSMVDERIESKLDGTILLVEGIGKSIDAVTKKETIVHHAMAVLSYDQSSGQYKFHTYLKDGKSADAWFNIISENNYAWGFDTPNGKIRYTIIIDPAKKTWHETGDFSRDGNNWMKFFEMNLSKVE